MEKKQAPFDWVAHYEDFVWSHCDYDDLRCKLRVQWDGVWLTVRPEISLFDENFDPDNIPEDYHYNETAARKSAEFRKANHLGKHQMIG